MLMTFNQNTLKHTQVSIHSKISLFGCDSLVVVCVSLCQPCNELVTLAQRLLGKAPAPPGPC